ncbi:MAG: SOS response-associated peptidase, partial [Bacteroidota bacterium]
NSFREAVRKRRCLVPADGFYEWKKTQTGKQPYYIGLQNRGVMHFAGISESWDSPQGERIYSFSILTMPPNELMEDLHDRMPMILDGQLQTRWLDPQTDVAELLGSISPYPTELMQAVAVSPEVGNVRNEHPGLIEPYTPPQLLF